ncbi:2-amino-4-hydroxy-6-hydroxymethyldihydropteridine diphosphokinase [Natronospira bacteriovora]|uniref:2-amino-4-hydroxy-6-hydroxymethyldihydropteridine pyrophosphokinase n=1 Tax=Natronospira bacteriovora TaxID=3069753 RepID=A0ABU0W8T9_9GAMM|nr:2-amino-4-hydroxy-6-hydroxymethyldihydropteridine diphosphokinase [Natronospira sp. AB-CW4]MDQ2069405.1 2-amino-4-hydroxy-6-hydroxymethyldihydropteridine diphosphokinase [Natronospira sp. AB-CW4]
MTASATAWIGLGANLGEPRAQVLQALAALEAHESMCLLRRSSLYRTPPMGPPGQPDYINAVAGIATGLTPEALLEQLLTLEGRLGRQRQGERWGPRVIDLDLLCYGNEQRHSDFLRLPHPGISERGFVLLPLAELAPGLVIPGHGRVRQLLDRLDVSDIEMIEAA